MLFNTAQFALFYLVAAVLYFALPQRMRSWFLLAASYYFYMCWSARYILVIIAITLFDYCAGIQIEQSRGLRRRICLLSSMVCNFGLLVFFKYANFFAAGIDAALRRFGIASEIPQLHWLLPVGISFHTFQAVSYTFDVYRGTVKAERNLGIYALYVAFFPQMVAGPIERPGHLLPQLHTPARFTAERLSSGLRMILGGLIKKTIVADLAASVVNTVYARPRDFPGGMLLLATVLFAVQIYCDFSGYSEMALGTARILGYDLTLNFRQPYFSRSLAEFWHRWHISLSTWFRDYLYIPLGGNRVSVARWCGIVAIVFLLSGLWHGANWTFVAWGALHAVYLVAGRLTARVRGKIAAISGLSLVPALHSAVQIAVTNILVTFAWIFFRAGSLRDAAFIVSRLLDLTAFPVENLFRAGLPRFEMTLLPICIPLVFMYDYICWHPLPAVERAWNRRPVRWSIYGAGLYSVVCFGIFTRVEFIYFQF